MTDERLIELLRALPAPPQAWLTRAREIPFFDVPPEAAEHLLDEGRDVIGDVDEPPACDIDHWDPAEDHHEPTSDADDPSGDGWLG